MDLLDHVAARIKELRVAYNSGEGLSQESLAAHLKVAPNTIIQAHTHRDTRTAVVISGLWHFGYGPKNEQALVKGLPLGAFYTEPAGESHFARTGPEGATVSITGYGPTDTVYAK